jgi:hypothetical protein
MRDRATPVIEMCDQVYLRLDRSSDRWVCAISIIEERDVPPATVDDRACRVDREHDAGVELVHGCREGSDGEIDQLLRLYGLLTG